MNFKDVLKNETDISSDSTILEAKVEKKKDQKEKPEEILRSANVKIKMVTGTAFGTQIDLFKKYPEEEIKEILKDYTIKIKDKSVFIVD
jgi:hypothetical protein